MLLAVEGGGFFSSSATGYSKGLTLLFFGRKTEERPMKVSPWNQYQLVDQESNPDFQLDSGKNRVSRGCATFGCFGCASAGLDGPSPPKVGPTQHQPVLQDPSSVSDNTEESNVDNRDDENGGTLYLKSSLKRRQCTPVVHEDDDPLMTSGILENYVQSDTGRRKVQWTDSCGKDLVEIREFELSEGSASDEEQDSKRTCACTIM